MAMDIGITLIRTMRDGAVTACFQAEWISPDVSADTRNQLEIVFFVQDTNVILTQNTQGASA
jgi:hypothetical protein